MARLRYDEPLYGDEIVLVDADERPNGLTSKVKRVLASEPKQDLYEVEDVVNRVLFVRRASGETWIQFYMERKS